MPADWYTMVSLAQPLSRLVYICIITARNQVGTIKRTSFKHFSINPRPYRGGGGGGATPLRVFADSEKTYAPPGFGYFMGQTLRNFWQQKLTGSGQVTEL